MTQTETQARKADEAGGETRPGLHAWMAANGKKPTEAAVVLGCTYQTVRRICLPFGHAERRTPDNDLLTKIVAWTEGQIGAADFYPESLGGRPPTEAGVSA